MEYQKDDMSTYSSFGLDCLPEIVESPEEYSMLKVYCKDNKCDSRSFLHNGVVDISLIDSPGLNIDTMKTTSLFSKQEEIDVVVFVVNAENHFTLSVNLIYIGSPIFANCKQ